MMKRIHPASFACALFSSLSHAQGNCFHFQYLINNIYKSTWFTERCNEIDNTSQIRTVKRWIIWVATVTRSVCEKEFFLSLHRNHSSFQFAPFDTFGMIHSILYKNQRIDSTLSLQLLPVSVRLQFLAASLFLCYERRQTVFLLSPLFYHLMTSSEQERRKKKVREEKRRS